MSDELDFMTALAKRLLPLCLATLLSAFSGCMTNTVIQDARRPKPTDVAPWANYLLLPITVPADIVTSPIQIPAYLSYARGERPGQVVPVITSAKD